MVVEVKFRCVASLPRQTSNRFIANPGSNFRNAVSHIEVARSHPCNESLRPLVAAVTSVMPVAYFSRVSPFSCIVCTGDPWVAAGPMQMLCLG